MSTIRRLSTAAFALSASLLLVTSASGQGNRFTVRVENVAAGETFALPDGSRAAAVIHPGAWFLYRAPVHETAFGVRHQVASAYFTSRRATAYGTEIPEDGGLLFTPGRTDRGEGLQRLARDGDPLSLTTKLATRAGVVSSGTFGSSSVSRTYEFSFTAEAGTVLTFAFKVGKAGDLFYAPADGAIALFDGKGRPVTGEVTARVGLWDAGFRDQVGIVGRSPIRRLDDAASSEAVVGRVIRVLIRPATVVSSVR